MAKPLATGPADTTMMGVVHDALRRDLARLDVVLAEVPPPSGDRRRAIADHVMWLMDWLHQHHTTEGVALWPLIRRQNPGAAALLDTMDAEHAAIGPAMEQVRSAARRYRDDDGDDARQALISALARLKEPLLTHLRDEEVEAMPVVSATITNAEWLDWDKKYNVKGKSLSRLGYEGHWLMDGLDPVRYQKLASLVPRPVFLVLRALYARPYRRACALRWGRSFQWAGRNPGQ